MAKVIVWSNKPFRDLYCHPAVQYTLTVNNKCHARNTSSRLRTLFTTFLNTVLLAFAVVKFDDRESHYPLAMFFAALNLRTKKAVAPQFTFTFSVC